jgi:hypothetical protein
MEIETATRKAVQYWAEHNLEPCDDAVLGMGATGIVLKMRDKVRVEGGGAIAVDSGGDNPTDERQECCVKIVSQGNVSRLGAEVRAHRALNANAVDVHLFAPMAAESGQPTEGTCVLRSGMRSEQNLCLLNDVPFRQR